MSASTPPSKPTEHAWPEMSPEEEEELRRDFAQAEEDEESGVPGISVDDVLPRRRHAG